MSKKSKNKRRSQNDNNPSFFERISKETWNAIQNLGAVGPDDIDDFMPPPGERQLSRPFQRPPSGYYFERDHLKELEEKCLIGLNPEDAKIMSSHIELYRLFRQSQIRRSEDNSIDLARSALDSDSDSYSESEISLSSNISFAFFNRIVESSGETGDDSV